MLKVIYYAKYSMYKTTPRPDGRGEIFFTALVLFVCTLALVWLEVTLTKT